MDLKKRFEEIANEYINTFVRKQDLDFFGWVGDTGSVACFNDEFYINFDDIRFDIDYSIKKDAIKEWYYKVIDGIRINYKSYCSINKLL